MKMTRITITHQLEKTKYVFLIQDPNILTQIEKERTMAKMNVEMLLINGRFYKTNGREKSPPFVLHQYFRA